MEHDDVEKAWEGVTNSIGAEEWMGAFRGGWIRLKKHSKQLNFVEFELVSSAFLLKIMEITHISFVVPSAITLGDR